MAELRARQLTKRFSGIAVVKDVDFTNDTARGGNGAAGQAGGDGLGGAIFNAGGDLIVDKSDFTNNTAQGGNGGAGADGGNGFGGAIYNVGSKVSVDHSEFTGNRALGGDGGQKVVGDIIAVNAAVLNSGLAEQYMSRSSVGPRSIVMT